MRDYQEEFLKAIKDYHVFKKYFGDSLIQRINTPHWFENWIIIEILRKGNWIEDQEQLLCKADIQHVKNSDGIFNVLRGDDRYYDLKILDVLAEIRLVQWANANGYTNIEKLLARNTGASDPSKIPDFKMQKDNRIVIAEAKHFRGRDYLPDFIFDRLRGMKYTTGCLNNFGINVDTTDKYRQIRDFLLETRKYCELGYRGDIRNELTEAWLKEQENRLSLNSDFESTIFHNLFLVKRSAIPHVAVGIAGPHNTKTKAAELMLEKLCGSLMNALEQIRSFIDQNQSVLVSKALVFLGGTSSWSMEWNDMWESLEIDRDNSMWEKVKEIHRQASDLIKLPFELIVGKDKEEETIFGNAKATKRITEYQRFQFQPE